jgi:carboxypeptidase family protein
MQITAAAIITLATAAPTFPGQWIITVQEPVTASWLAGEVVDPSGAPMGDVRVEECDEGWKTVKRSTQTNREGHFRFRTAGLGTHYLRFSVSGFQTMEIRVKVNYSATHKLHIDMTVAV